MNYEQLSKPFRKFVLLHQVALPEIKNIIYSAGNNFRTGNYHEKKITTKKELFLVFEGDTFVIEFKQKDVY